MAYFKIDINSANLALVEFKKHKDFCLEELQLLYASLENVDFCWNDVNSLTFKNVANNDKISILSYFSNIDILCSKLENFLDELKKIVIKFNFTNTMCVIKFDDQNVNLCNNRLSNIIYYLNNAINIIDNSLLNSNYKNQTHLYNLRAKLCAIINAIEVIKNRFEEYVKLILELLKKYGDQISAIDELDFVIKKN